MTDEYLNGNVKEIIEPMISALLIAQPEDPKFFMLHWLKNLYSLDYIVINKEKEELENLRLKVKDYKSQKSDTNKQNVEQPLEELKNKITEDPKETQNTKDIINETNKENENINETNKENQNVIETNNVNETNKENLIDTNNENKKNTQSNNISKNISVNENKTETQNFDTKNENQNENEEKKDLIDFSEESEK